MRIRTTSFLVGALLLSGTLAAQNLKFATYHITQFSNQMSSQRESALKSILMRLNADVIAFQGITHPGKLTELLPRGYRLASGSKQKARGGIVLAFRRPFVIKSSHFVYPDPKLDAAFPEKQDLLHVATRAYRRDFHFLVHHARQRGASRQESDPHRRRAAQMILFYMRAQLRSQPVVLLGDFNDNPDDASLNILETGRNIAEGGIDTEPDRYLFNTTEPLLDEDHCSYGLHLVPHPAQGDLFSTTVPGASRENLRWIAKDPPHDQPPRVGANLFDQILVSRALQPRVVDVGIFNEKVAIAGGSAIGSTGNGLQVRQEDLPSEHLPVWLNLRL